MTLLRRRREAVIDGNAQIDVAIFALRNGNLY